MFSSGGPIGILILGGQKGLESKQWHESVVVAVGDCEVRNVHSEMSQHEAMMSQVDGSRRREGPPIAATLAASQKLADIASRRPLSEAKAACALPKAPDQRPLWSNS